MKLHAELIGESPATKAPCGRNISACSTVRVEMGNGDPSDWETWDVASFVAHGNACKGCIASMRRMRRQAMDDRRTVTVTHNGFHGRTVIRFRPQAIGGNCLTGETWYHVSPRTARRLDREVCGHSDCRCGEHVAEPVYQHPDYSRPHHYIIVAPRDGSELRGNYPQQ